MALIIPIYQKRALTLALQIRWFYLTSFQSDTFLTVQQQLELVDHLTGSKEKAKANQLFDDLGITGLKHQLPQELSGGERQRAAIARALYHDPALILADEPTASLDTEKAYEVVKLLAKESKEKTRPLLWSLMMIGC